jgi:hypothetical protein
LLDFGIGGLAIFNHASTRRQHLALAAKATGAFQATFLRQFFWIFRRYQGFYARQKSFKSVIFYENIDRY